MEPIISASARKHGIEDDDMLHAYRWAGRAFPLDEGLVMYVGPDRDARMLEVGVVRSDEGAPVIVHSMLARRKFWR